MVGSDPDENHRPDQPRRADLAQATSILTQILAQSSSGGWAAASPSPPSSHDVTPGGLHPSLAAWLPWSAAA
jgi:hypothetical protein